VLATGLKSFQDDTAREFDRIADHCVTGRGSQGFVAVTNRMRQIGVQTCYLREVSETVTMDVKEPA
jgi:hypothetical protein